MRALMSLAGVAKETLEICERGVYRAPSGATVSTRAEVDRAADTSASKSRADTFRRG